MPTPAELQQAYSQFGFDKLQGGTPAPTPTDQPVDLTSMFNTYNANRGINQPTSAGASGGATTDQGPGLAEQAANTINKGYQAYTQLPGIKQAGEAGGAVVGAAGQVIGGAVGGVGETLLQSINALEGKGFDANRILQSIKETAASTGNFGQQIGQAGTVAAPVGPVLEALGPIGALGGAAMSYGQGYQGVKDVGAAVKSGNWAQGVQGAGELAMSTLGAKSAIEGAPGLPKMPEAPALSDMAQSHLENAYSKALNIPPNSKIGVNELEWGKNTPKVLSQERAPITLDESGKLDLGQAIDKLKATHNTEAAAVQKLYDTSGQVHSLDQNRQDAITSAKSNLAARGTDLPKAIDYINKQFDALKQTYINNKQGMQYGNDVLVPTGVAANIKSEFWNKAFDAKFPSKEDIALSKGDYAIGDALRNDIQGKVSDANIQAANKRLGDLAEAIKVLQEKNGKSPAKIGVVKGLAVRGAGAALGGALGGLPGAAIGGYITDSLVKHLSGRSADIALWSKVSDILGKTEGGPDLIKQVNDTLSKRQQAQSARRLLPEPAPQVSGTPDSSGARPQSEAVANLRSQGVQGPLTQAEQRGGQKLLSAPAPQISSTPENFKLYSQEEAIQKLRELGFEGPLKKSEQLASLNTQNYPKS